MDQGQRKTYRSPLELKAGTAGAAEGDFRATFATFGTKDWDGDVTVAGAFTQNQAVRIAAWGHNWGVLPVGKGTIHADSHRAWVDGSFFLDTAAGADTYRTVKQLGDLQEWSYGFIITKWSVGQHDGAKVRFLEGLDVFEVSPVLLGAGIGTGTARIKAAPTPDAEPPPEVEPAAGTKRAIGAHSTGTSTGSWDGPANERRLPNDAAALRRAHAWMDGDGDPAAKATYKFGHHEVSGSGSVGAANLTACSSGIAVLNGGRSGTTIPDSDRQGVWAHLARHLRDGSREPPPLKAAGLSILDAGEHVLADLDEYAARLANASDDEALAVKDYAGGLLRRLQAVRAELDGALKRADDPAALHPHELHRRYAQFARRFADLAPPSPQPPVPG